VGTDVVRQGVEGAGLQNYGPIVFIFYDKCGAFASSNIALMLVAVGQAVISIEIY
jgi:hypothetical protein